MKLVEGQDIRDHNNYVFNNTIGQATLGGIYLGTASFGGGQVRLDEVGFTLPSSFQSSTLTDIILHGYGNYPIGNPFLAAATVTNNLIINGGFEQPTPLWVSLTDPSDRVRPFSCQSRGKPRIPDANDASSSH